VKLLYDIYHMQIMEGDLIRNIRDNIEHIAHFHTAAIRAAKISTISRRFSIRL
jgi:hydroxypyruvate isomerase